MLCLYSMWHFNHYKFHVGHDILLYGLSFVLLFIVLSFNDFTYFDNSYAISRREEKQKIEEEQKLKSKLAKSEETFDSETISKTVTTYDLSDLDSEVSSQENNIELLGITAHQGGRTSGRHNRVLSESESSALSGDEVDEEIIIEYNTKKKNKPRFHDRLSPITTGMYLMLITLHLDFIDFVVPSSSSISVITF